VELGKLVDGGLGLFYEPIDSLAGTVVAEAKSKTESEPSWLRGGHSSLSATLQCSGFSLYFGLWIEKEKEKEKKNWRIGK
jgi:hypothetical protein